MKRLLPLLFLAACAAEPAPDAASPVDTFRANLAADYPVTLTPLADGVWVHTTNYTLPGSPPLPYNGLAVIDGDAVTLVDAARGELATLALIDAVQAEAGLPVARMIVTHHKGGRTQGVDAAEREGIEVFSHPDTPALARDLGFPVPDTSVAGLKEPRSRGRVGRIEIAYPGPGPAPDTIIAYIPEEALLYGGGLILGAEAATLGKTAGADLSAWRDSLLWLKATYPETRTVVPGQGKGAGLGLIDRSVAMIDAALAETVATPDAE